jgi:hypothetical protein
MSATEIMHTASQVHLLAHNIFYGSPIENDVGQLVTLFVTIEFWAHELDAPAVVGSPGRTSASIVELTGTCLEVTNAATDAGECQEQKCLAVRLVCSGASIDDDDDSPLARLATSSVQLEPTVEMR